ncbi:MAG: M1 family metallopeptidase [Pseudomonadota bacterium]
MRGMSSVKSILVGAFAGLLAIGNAAAQVEQTKGSFVDKFRQLEEILPTPNVYRTASGAPGHQYWQQRADYRINVSIDDDKQILTGSETITYTNNSPDQLRYIWVQLDQNRFAKHSDNYRSETLSGSREIAKAGGGSSNKLPYSAMRRAFKTLEFDGGHKIDAVTDASGANLPYTINQTMMRIDLPTPLKPSASLTFNINWHYNITPSRQLGGLRSGYEFFKDDENYLYLIAQWYPRVAAYTDATGWNNKQFLGRGEFTLEFGDYEVAIEVPADHVVSSTGELTNADTVLTATQQKRLETARTAKAPVFIVSPEEAVENQKTKAKGRKTWVFKAENVRDFAFATSRKFIWDAVGYKQPTDGKTIMAMSFYPDEAEPLWSKYSTKTIVHTMKVYSKYSFPYPYPTAQSVNGPVSGMEYPMITFNGPRPVIDKETGERTYTRRAKYGLISVIIHEIGHIYFPMTVNTDERQWTWMDEGINTFLQFLAQEEWEEGYPSRRGEARKIVSYMRSQNQVPIMTNSESILQFGNNAYGKPATALNILRETVMGRELFDFAFKEYARRWAFKRPYPADFFRTMEDASGVDLDWFWRGWFYSTDHVDISIDRVVHAHINTEDPDIEEALKRKKKADEPVSITVERNKGMPRAVEADPDLLDFYNENDEFTVSGKQRKAYEKLIEDLEDWEAELLKRGEHVYFLQFSNKGGLVMPVILDVTFKDGSKKEYRWPAEIWRYTPHTATKMVITEKEIAKIVVDPRLETADVDLENNTWPAEPVESRLELFKRKKSRNLMKEIYDDQKPDEEDGDDTDSDDEDK